MEYSADVIRTYFKKKPNTKSNLQGSAKHGTLRSFESCNIGFRNDKQGLRLTFRPEYQCSTKKGYQISQMFISS